MQKFVEVGVVIALATILLVSGIVWKAQLPGMNFLRFRRTHLSVIGITQIR
jgi:hypothetical protein